MRLFRRALAGVVAGAIVAATAATALASGKGPEARFRDWRDGFWANESLARLHVLGVIQGNADGTLTPNRPITHLEAAIMLARYLGLEPSGDFRGKVRQPGGKWSFRVDGEDVRLELKRGSERFEIRFKDDRIEVRERDGGRRFEFRGQVPAWGRTAVAAALEHGFLITDGSRLQVTRPLSRLHAAMMLVKAVGLDDAARDRAGADPGFADATAIPAHLRGYVALAVENNLITGYPDGTFQPNRPVTRAEWAALLDRLDRRAEEPPAPGRVTGTLTAARQGAVAIDGVRYALADDAWVFIGGQQATADQLRPGDQVLVQLDAAGRVQLILVLQRDGGQPDAGQVQQRVGIVAAVRPEQRELVLDTGSELVTVRYAADMPVQYGALWLDAGTLAAGQRLAARGRLAGSVLTADRMTISVSGSTVRFPATFQGHGPASLSFTYQGTVHTFPAAGGAIVSAVGVQVGLDWLAAGDGLELTVRDGLVTDAELFSRDRVSWTGVVTTLDRPARSLQLALVLPDTALGTVAAATWDANTFFTGGGVLADAGALEVGQVVIVTGSLQGKTTLEALHIALP